MGTRIRWASLGLLGVAACIALTACISQWLAPPVEPTLAIGDPVVAGGRGEVLLSVVDMPDGGLAAMAVLPGGMTYAPAKVTNVTLVGLNGFIVLASEFAGGHGRFVIVNPSAGRAVGPIAKLTFDVSGAVTSGDLAFVVANIQLGSDEGALIASWVLGTGKPYYAE